MAARLLVMGGITVGVGAAAFLSRRRSQQGAASLQEVVSATTLDPVAADAACSTSRLTHEQARVIINNRASITSHIVERRNLLYKRGAYQLLGYGALVFGALFIHVGLALFMLVTCAALFNHTFLDHALSQMRQAKDMEASFDEAERMVQFANKATLQRLSGTWKKDKTASESMGPAMDIMKLNPFVRRAVVLMTGLRLKQSLTDFELQVLTVVPGYKIVERYPMTGAPAYWKRRDLRRGKHEGHVALLADGSIRVSLKWGEPFSGEGDDLYFLKDDNTLHVASTLRSSGQSTTYITVYTRRT